MYFFTAWTKKGRSGTVRQLRTEPRRSMEKSCPVPAVSCTGMTAQSIRRSGKLTAGGRIRTGWKKAGSRSSSTGWTAACTDAAREKSQGCWQRVRTWFLAGMTEAQACSIPGTVLCTGFGREKQRPRCMQAGKAGRWSAHSEQKETWSLCWRRRSMSGIRTGLRRMEEKRMKIPEDYGSFWKRQRLIIIRFCVRCA